MAEFQEVAEQKRRMCKMYENNGCNGCPLNNYDCGVLNIRYTEANDVQRVENVVMSWAAEHPEPVYPTWAEWLNSTGLTKHDTGQFCVHTPNQYSYEVKGVDILNEAAYKPIPADIAGKLGIEPKEPTP